MEEIDKILNARGFHIKEWTCNNKPMADSEESRDLLINSDSQETEGVLGMKWDFQNDLLLYKVNVEDLIVVENPTKRNILSMM